MDKQTVYFIKKMSQQWDNFKDIDTSEYDIYDSPLYNEEKLCFNIQFIPGKLIHSINSMPSQNLKNWVELNEFPDKLEAFYLWGNATYAATRYWDGSKNYLRHTFEDFKDPTIKITDNQLEEILGNCKNMIEVASVLLKVLGTELHKIKRPIFYSDINLPLLCYRQSIAPYQTLSFLILSLISLMI